MSLLPQYKIGDCSIEGCGLKDTQGRKVGKNFICADHYRNAKQKEQVTKANTRNKVRGLVKYERAEGVLDDITELTIDIDRVLSRYIRIRDMEADGKITCYTCGARKEWKKMHCSHFIKRIELGTRFLLDNVRCACYECNVEKRGNLKVYAERLNQEKPGITEWLQEQAHQVNKPTRNELKEILHDYQLKLNTVENAKLKML